MTWNKYSYDGGEAFQCHIEGMDCPDCAAKIEKVVGVVQRLAKARVDFTGETLTAQVDSPETAARVRGTIRSLGYDIAEGGHRITSILNWDE